MSKQFLKAFKHTFKSIHNVLLFAFLVYSEELMSCNCLIRILVFSKLSHIFSEV